MIFLTGANDDDADDGEKKIQYEGEILSQLFENDVFALAGRVFYTLYNRLFLFVFVCVSLTVLLTVFTL